MEFPKTNQNRIKIGIIGACGKMGRRLFELAAHDDDLEITFALEQKGTAAIGKELGKIKVSSNPDGVFLTDVVIDFTVPQASMANLSAVARHRKALVLGTTGFSAEELREIEEASKVIPVVFSPNMSVGVNVLFSILPEIARRLGREYKIEIVEAHHTAKRDAPSGTARKCAEVLQAYVQEPIPTHSIRLGDIVGDHTIIFCGNAERIEVKHQAHSRDLFAIGALKAAKWVHGKPPGLYSMQQVLEKKHDT